MSQAKDFLQKLKKQKLSQSCDVVICSPFTCLSAFDGMMHVTLGAQNFYPKESGAYTGEISASMLKEHGVKVVLVGHSERRNLFGETDEFINEKVKVALSNDMYVIFCIGETLEQREKGLTEKVLKQQIVKGLCDVKLPLHEKYILCVAYEPVWAIGTGMIATSEMIERAHTFVKLTLEKMFPGVTVPILYGGSVNEKNASVIINLKNVDGVLVGGASLDPEKFAQICNYHLVKGLL